MHPALRDTVKFYAAAAAVSLLVVAFRPEWDSGDPVITAPEDFHAATVSGAPFGPPPCTVNNWSCKYEDTPEYRMSYFYQAYEARWDKKTSCWYEAFAGTREMKSNNNESCTPIQRPCAEGGPLAQYTCVPCGPHACIGANCHKLETNVLGDGKTYVSSNGPRYCQWFEQCSNEQCVSRPSHTCTTQELLLCGSSQSCLKEYCGGNRPVEVQCGNKRIDKPEEQCDDGNADNKDGCSSVCVVETGYTCSGEPSSCKRAPLEAPPPVPNLCGNGKADAGEVCDLSAKKDCEQGTCSKDCQCIFPCKDNIDNDNDGLIDKDDFGCYRREIKIPGEYEEDNRNEEHTPQCGNGHKEPAGKDGRIGTGDDEECDDGNKENNDGCVETCKLPICGDGFQNKNKHTQETCDYKMEGQQFRCYQPPRAPEEPEADICHFCGDGTLQKFREQCDPGDDPTNLNNRHGNALCWTLTGGNLNYECNKECDCVPRSTDQNSSEAPPGQKPSPPGSPPESSSESSVSSFSSFSSSSVSSSSETVHEAAPAGVSYTVIHEPPGVFTRLWNTFLRWLGW